MTGCISRENGQCCPPPYPTLTRRSLIEHCIEWARAKFNDLFVEPFKGLQKLATNVEVRHAVPALLCACDASLCTHWPGLLGGPASGRREHGPRHSGQVAQLQVKGTRGDEKEDDSFACYSPVAFPPSLSTGCCGTLPRPRQPTPLKAVSRLQFKSSTRSSSEAATCRSVVVRNRTVLYNLCACMSVRLVFVATPCSGSSSRFRRISWTRRGGCIGRARAACLPPPPSI